MVTIMKESTVKILDDKDMEFVETLRSLGVPRNVATLITFLANVDEASSREIEMGSDLTQVPHGNAHFGLPKVRAHLNLARRCLIDICQKCD